jgi:competence protein ComEC
MAAEIWQEIKFKFANPRVLPSDSVVYLSVSFLLGLAAFSLNFSVYFSLAAVFILLLIPVFIKKISFGYFFIALLIFILGFIYFNFYHHFQENSQKIIYGQNISFSGVIVNEPRQKEKSQVFTLSLVEPLKGQIEVLTSPSPVWHYGDLINLKGVINLPQNNFYLPLIAFPSIGFQKAHQGFYIKEILLNLKNSLTGVFPKFLSSQNAAFLSGLTFGERSSFSPEFKQEMALSGTTHLIALSGYNISLIVVAIGLFLGSFLSRRKTFYLTAVIIFLFVVMVGAEASIVRAAVMGFLALLAKELGRLYSFRNAIVLTALAMNILDPSLLVFNLGFQLSFLSLLGIVYLLPTLESLFRIKSGGFLDWKENALMTLSSQLAVAPLLLIYFNQLSLTSLFANILILEAIPLTMILGFILAFLGTLSYYLAWPIGLLTGLFLTYEIKVIDFFAYFSFPIRNISLSWLIIVFYYSLLLALIFNNFKKKNEKI